MKSIFSPLPQHLCQLCGSGEMSLAGSTVGRSVACELCLGGTTQICFDQTAVRNLGGVASGQISMNCFYGKVVAPGGLGSFYKGGYYTGVVSLPPNYYLVVAPNATGCANCQWKTTATATSGTGSCVNGYANTYNGLANASHPAGNFTATRTINGFSDWYLPARDELNILFTNRTSMPAGECVANGLYWSSTDLNAVCACMQYFNPASPLNGLALGGYKAYNAKLRAVRRVPV